MAPDVRTIILTHTFIDPISFYSIFSSKWIMQSSTINFPINHWYKIKSRSSEISQIKLTLLLLFLLFAEHKGISSNGTIHNIMASGIFIQNGMIAQNQTMGWIYCSTITTKRTVFLILLMENEDFYVYSLFLARYTILEENWRLLDT